MTFPTLLGIALEGIDAPNPQQVLADAIGVHQGTLSHWENAQRKPRDSLWPRIAQALGVTLPELGAAMAVTAWDRPPPLREQLRECQARLAELEQENRLLRTPAQAPV